MGTNMVVNPLLVKMQASWNNQVFHTSGHIHNFTIDGISNFIMLIRIHTSVEEFLVINLTMPVLIVSFFFASVLLYQHSILFLLVQLNA